MTLSYVLRLATLSFASFFLVAAAASAAIAAYSDRLIRFAGRMEARWAARVVFTLRIVPAALAMIAVIGLCIPSYLWLEPSAESEDVGVLGSIAALAGAAMVGRSIARGRRAIVEMQRYVAGLRGKEMRIAGGTAVAIEGRRTTVAVGLLRPVVFVSRDVVAALSEEQLELAILHERSHARARDNLKRLAMMLAPSAFSLRKIEQAWRRFAEWAADDAAVAGDRARSLALAETLVRVARIGAHREAALATPLLGEDFSARVERLIEGPAQARAPRWEPAALACVAAGALLARPSTLGMVHRVLEKLIR